MVIHVLKRNPTVKDLEHVKVDSLGTVYLFFYENQGFKRLSQEVMENLQVHLAKVFAEWISQEEDLQNNVLLRMVGKLTAVLAQER